MTKKDTIVAHPGVQHSYMLALAIQESGRLKNYITSFFYKDLKFPYSLLTKIKKIDAVLRKRFNEELNQELVINIPYYELVEQFARFIFGNTATTNKFVYWRDREFDRYVSLFSLPKDVRIFIGYPNACYYSFKRIKNRGGICIVDLPIAYYREAILILEEEKNLHPDFADSITYANFDSKYRFRIDNELEVADFIVCPSQFVKETLIKHGFNSEKLIKIPYGSFFKPVDQKEIREKKKKNLKVIYAGQVSQRKGVKYLLEAVKKLKKEGYDIELTLVGKIYGSGEGLKKYEGLYNYSPQVSRDVLRHLFMNCDIFVFPSLFEGFGLVILEALACGLPVITTHNTGAEAIIEGENGFVIPIRDIQALVDRLALLYEERERLFSMKLKAIESVKKFSWENYKEKWKEFIDEL